MFLNKDFLKYKNIKPIHIHMKNKQNYKRQLIRNNANRNK